MLNQRLWKILLLLIITTLLLAACGSGDTEETATETTTDESSAEVADAPAAESDDTMEEACTDVITLGAAVSETGQYAREGKDTRQGYNTWLNWVNNEYGGIKVGDQCYKVEIVYYDDEGDPDTAANLVERLITEDEVDFLLGPYSSGLTMSTSAIAEKYGVIMIEGNGASEDIFSRGFQNIFAVLTPAGNYTESALKALADMGAKTVAIAYEDTAFPTSCSSNV